MKTAVVRFPGSNCDQDVVRTLRDNFAAEADYVWHKETSLQGYDAVVLPGGFSYGDYLRCGAIARFSPVMRAVAAAAARGVPVLGICNGFQILCEAGLLPGALIRNRGLLFVCRQVHVRVESEATPLTGGATGRVLRLPVAHGEGCYFADPETLRELEESGRVVFRYCQPDGGPAAAANPNGSLRDIAGICSPAGNVTGLMPHPERACEDRLGSSDGRVLFANLLAAAGRSGA